jgi:acetyltransferase
MRAGDAAMHDDFIARLSPDDLRFRFGNRIVEVRQGALHGIAKVDREREITFVAITPTAIGTCDIVGEVRLQEGPDGERAEFAIAVRSDIQRQGLGRALLEKAIAVCRGRHVRLLYGLVDRSNTSMIALAQRLGFDIDEVPTGATVVASMEL